MAIKLGIKFVATSFLHIYTQTMPYKRGISIANYLSNLTIENHNLNVNKTLTNKYSFRFETAYIICLDIHYTE